MDNYSYVITDEETGVSVLVDPADADTVQSVLRNHGITPTAILVTHKHWDHSGGNKQLRSKHRGLAVYGGRAESVPGATHTVNDGDELRFGRLSFTARVTPGHTSGHTVYVLDGTPFGAPTSLFSGDLIFLGGAGRMFEGTAAAMLSSLDVVCSLPDNTLLWPGHEYAASNLDFGAHIDSECMAIKDKQDEVAELRKTNQCTCPSTMAEEKCYNLFLRTNDVRLQTLMGVTGVNSGDEDPRQITLSRLRQAKDKYKYEL
ncbi:hypothetical protein CAPTEDRAFT_149878 [Capitella teleta]|uniref:Metallo-beta-lactamase domain-containing protein n=1 Tax=Capitella teleta TaxID=283909 RepID=R7TJ80_CAPTE|nr:hypothetical protein CAPTEDRAFT_149878 [Capitella teleta]|eukprot:ELT91606.1 hypothetical protein CAPTEDRAFT_149878 [Capitella teleta]